MSRGAGVFLSYRRGDSSPYAGRLYDHLVAHLGTTSVFMDVDSIRPGVDFVEALDDALAGCGTVIAVIGPGWVEATDRNGRPRLEDPTDFVRRELETALERGVRIIPVLVQGAALPSEDELPPSLAPLLRRQAFDVTDRHWRRDVGELVELVAESGRSAPETAARSNPGLPTATTLFVGRDEELTALAALLRRPDVRLVTVTGPGGTGKTRLASQAAAAVADAFPDGVALVELASVADPRLLLPTVARALGVPEAPGEPLLDQVLHATRERRALVVADNFEHLLPAAPELATLLGGTDHLTFLVTSRVLLRLAAEREYPLGPLEGSDAVELFTQRSRAARASFALTEVDRRAVAEICRRLDGLPLAIELAAARAGVLSPEALLARLEQPLRLLTKGARDAPARHRTLRATLAWSHDLLEEAEQVLFARLGVFVGGWTLEAAEEVCGDEDVDVLDALDSLVDHSLVVRDDSGPELRFSYLETIRDFAVGQLHVRGEHDALGRAHARWYLELAEAQCPGLWGGDQVAAAARLELEHANLRAALAWAADGDGETGVRLVAVLWRFWWLHGHLADGGRWLERFAAEASASATPPALKAEVLTGLGSMAGLAGDFDACERYSAEALGLWRELGDRHRTAFLSLNVGLVRYERDEWDHAYARWDEALTIGRTLDDSFWRSFIVGAALHNLAELRQAQGDFSGARALYEQAEEHVRAADDWEGLLQWLLNMGSLELQIGDDARAAERLAEAEALLEQCGGAACLCWGLDAFALLAHHHGDHAAAARLLGAGERLRDSMGAPLQRMPLAIHDELVTTLRKALGHARYDDLRTEGRALSMEQVLAALRDVGTPEVGAPPTS